MPTDYGSSFITDNKGQFVEGLDRETEGIRVVELDLPAYAAERATWGLFRNRRPEKYGALMILDGTPRP